MSEREINPPAPCDGTAATPVGVSVTVTPADLVARISAIGTSRAGHRVPMQRTVADGAC